jgi:hypothetical protein
MCSVPVTYYLEQSRFILKGKETEILSVNKEYKERGYISKSKNISIKSNINDKKLGRYKVKYYINNRLVKTREVIIRDNIKPNIVLKEGNLNLYLNAEYHEFGYNAIDNYDGDITNKVVVSNNINTNKIGTYYVKYKVKDSSGNENIVERQVNVVEDSPSKGIPILLYHFFYDSSLGEKPRRGDEPYSMDIMRFREEMKYLKDNNYYFPSWDELEQYISGNISLPDKSIIITIDDGNESFFRLAYPVLKEYEIRATLFIITSWIPLDRYSFVDRNLIDYESHTNNMHVSGCKGKNGGIFLCTNYDKAYNDVLSSINVLGSKKVFSYPFGSYNDRTVEIVQKAGFNMAVTIEKGKVNKGTNKYLLPRISTYDSYNLNDFINVIK